MRIIARQAENFTLFLLNSEIYKAEDFSEEPLRSFNQKILSEFERIKALRKNVVTGEQAMEKSQSEYLSKADRILLCEYERTISEKYNLESLMRKLTVPSEKQLKNFQAFQEIEMGVRTKISDLQKSMVEIYPKIKSVEEKMKNPYRKKSESGDS